MESIEFKRITTEYWGLFKQFCAAYGLENRNASDPSLIKAFFEWLEEEKHPQTVFYQTFLEEMDNFRASDEYLGKYFPPFGFRDARSLEVGKTVHDSIVLPYETKIATQYPQSMEEYGNRVIVGNLHFHGDFPVILEVKAQGPNHATPIDQYNMVLTQNPYFEKDLELFEKLPFTGKRTLVGVYGDVNDADRESKIRMIEEYRKRLDQRCEPTLMDVSEGDYYSYIVATEKSILR